MDMDDDACYRAIETRDHRFDGRLFVAVVTTGIYCRPFCPARTPKRDNVRFFPTAAAAQEAGFRPCLRCRPETSPDLAFWRGSSNTVSRALGLIEAGALDDANVESLAARLGMGERQLRRLFNRHLGASPASVAATRRILLAKQLIQDTRLPMTEVAAAAGFGSLRRFNETFRQLYGRPPKAIRRSGVAEESVAATGAIVVKLGYRPPYDWDSMLSFLRARAIPGVESVSRSRYARTIAIGDGRGVLVVEPAERNCLKATVRFPNLNSLPAIIARIRRVFDLAADPVAIGAHLSRDPLLARLVAARPGLRVPGAWDGFELAVRAILGQQITVLSATSLAGKLVLLHGEKMVEFGGARPRAHSCVSDAAAIVRRRSGRARNAESEANGAVVVGGGSGRRPADLRCPQKSRRGHRAAANTGRDRRMDGPIHRHARTARAGCLPGCRYRPAASDARREWKATVTGPITRTRRTVATLARLRDAASLGVRVAQLPGCRKGAP